MKSRLLVAVAVLGLLGSSISFAQSGLGKKGSGGGRSSGSMGGGSGRVSGSTRSGGSFGSGRDIGRPDQTRNSGRGSGSVLGRPDRTNSGRGSGSVLGRPDRTNNGGGSGSVLGRPDRTNGNSGSGTILGRPDRTNGNSGSGTILGRPDRTNGNSGSGSVLGRPDRTNGNSGSGTILGRPDRTNGNSGSGTILGRPDRTNGNSGSGSVLGRPDRTNGNSGSGSVLGRPDRANGDVLGKKGSVAPNSNNNVAGGSPGRITDVPRVGSNNRIVTEGHRENRIQVNTRYRNGYSHYDRNWGNNNFFFGHYGFQWYSGCNYIASPFYYYGHLPGYVSLLRVSFGPFSYTRCYSRYNWVAPRYTSISYGRDQYANLDYSVGDIRRAFENRSMRYFSGLIPRNGRVEIDVDQGDQYAVNTDDFYTMMRDLVEGTQTTAYRITNVYRDGNRATVEAIHEYTDASGRQQIVYHTIGLQTGSRGYEITYFRTNQ